jgi:hypothetical protein
MERTNSHKELYFRPPILRGQHKQLLTTTVDSKTGF